MPIDYRSILLKNSRKTCWVICSFILMYVFIGLLCDVAFNTFHQFNMPASSKIVNASFFDSFFSFITFARIPYFTLIAISIGIISILIIFKFHHQLILWGNDYTEIKRNNEPRSLAYIQALNILEEIKIAANMKTVPKLFLIDAPYMNAFSSGLNENNSMIAVTSSLVENLSRSELQAVLAHEMSHILHLDIKLTLFIGILSNLALLFINGLFDMVRITGFKKTDGNSGLFANILIVILRISLPLLTTILSLYLSRSREYMADAQAIKITQNPQSLASALLKIEQSYINNPGIDKGKELRMSAYIYSPPPKFFHRLFSSHPSLEQRLSALGIAKVKS